MRGTRADRIAKMITALAKVLLTAVSVAAVVVFGRQVFADGFDDFLENLTLLSVKAVTVTAEIEDNEPQMTASTTSTTTSEVITTSTTLTTTVTTSTTEQTTAATQSTTIPTGDNIRKISEKQYITTSTGYNGIYVKNGNENHGIDIEEVLSRKPLCEIDPEDEYSVLIVHTHTTESYHFQDLVWYDKATQWRNTDSENNVTAVGKVLAETLNNAGIRTLHITEIHDYPKYNGSYNRAKQTIEKYLELYPGIQMVIDVHRDSITQSDGTKIKPTAVINGKKAAQIMIISGCNDTGKLDFPNWEYNLRMAVALQARLTQDWPGLARPLYFAPFRYNMHLTNNSLLLEFGTEANTLEEAKYTAEMVGQSLSELLKEYITEEEVQL